MIAVESVPHDYLFPKCKIVIHHCGFGTAAATLIYGVPSIPIPHILDQRGFADMLVKLGAAGKQLNGNEFTQEMVVSCIREMEAHYDERYHRVQVISQKLQEEKGLENAVKQISLVLQQIKLHNS